MSAACVSPCLDLLSNITPPPSPAPPLSLEVLFQARLRGPGSLLSQRTFHLPLLLAPRGPHPPPRGEGIPPHVPPSTDAQALYNLASVSPGSIGQLRAPGRLPLHTPKRPPPTPTLQPLVEHSTVSLQSSSDKQATSAAQIDPLVSLCLSGWVHCRVCLCVCSPVRFVPGLA